MTRQALPLLGLNKMGLRELGKGAPEKVVLAWLAAAICDGIFAMGERTHD